MKINDPTGKGRKERINQLGPKKKVGVLPPSESDMPQKKKNGFGGYFAEGISTMYVCLKANSCSEKKPIIQKKANESRPNGL